MRFRIPTAHIINITVFEDVALCGIVEADRPDDEGSNYLRNVVQIVRRGERRRGKGAVRESTYILENVNLHRT